MKKSIGLVLVLTSILFQFSGCAPMRHTWPDLASNIGDRIDATQEKIGSGLQRKMLTIDQSQMFLATLESIRNEYIRLRGSVIYRDQWDDLNRRLDNLNEDINRELTPPPVSKVEEGVADDKIATLQQTIDKGRNSRQLTAQEVEDFQARLNSIRRDYLRMKEGGRYLTHDEKSEISRRLDYLEEDLNRAWYT